MRGNCRQSYEVIEESSSRAVERDARGIAFNVTVTMKDAYGNVVTGYRGTVHFSNSDSTATLPANYVFTASDTGVHTFTGLVLRKRVGNPYGHRHANQQFDRDRYHQCRMREVPGVLMGDGAERGLSSLRPRQRVAQ